MEKGWQRVYFSEQPHKIEIAKALLKENNIDSYPINKKDSSYTAVGEIELYVKEEDAILARFLIEQNKL